MKQSTADIDIVQKTFNLTEQEKYLLLEAAVGEGLFFAGRKHVSIFGCCQPNRKSNSYHQSSRNFTKTTGICKWIKKISQNL